MKPCGMPSPRHPAEEDADRLRKVGEVTQRMRQEGVLAKQGRPKKITPDDVSEKTSSSVMFLSDLGINPNIAASSVTGSKTSAPPGGHDQRDARDFPVSAPWAWGAVGGCLHDESTLAEAVGLSDSLLQKPAPAADESAATAA